MSQPGAASSRKVAQRSPDLDSAVSKAVAIKPHQAEHSHQRRLRTLQMRWNSPAGIFTTDL